MFGEVLEDARGAAQRGAVTMRGLCEVAVAARHGGTLA